MGLLAVSSIRQARLRQAISGFFLEIEGCGINTETHAGGLIGRISEHVPKMTTAVSAGDFYTTHAERIIFGQFDRLDVGRVIEARPAAAAVKLSIALENDGPASRANEITGPMFI